ncbi:MAG: DUF4167 domain-containing protein [Alphaproteobacteria bacterium]
MRHGTSGRRQRNRNNNNGGGSRRNNNQRSQVFDSNGPDVRIRGTAHQVAEKYLALAKDATTSGDRIVAESYYQHAEHYIRLINEVEGKFDSSKVLGNKTEDLADNAGNKTVDTKKDDVEDLGLPASIVGKATKETEAVAD